MISPAGAVGRHVHRVAAAVLPVRGRPGIAIRRLATLAWLAYGRPLLGQDVNLSSRHTTSSVAVDVVIPATDKDLTTLPLAVHSVRMHLKHPVGTVYVIGPIESAVRGLCDGLDVTFVDESTACRIPKRQIEYVVDGVDRSGWLFQQFIKLSADGVARTDKFLVMDADTALIRDQVFEHRGKTIVNQSDEFHQPYRDAYRRVTGTEPSSSLSFVTHHMLFDKEQLRQLKADIEARGQMNWEDYILASLDYSESSNFSEYELYGNHLMRSEASVQKAFWFNIALDRSALPVDDLDGLASGWTKSVSFHSYLNEQ